MRSSWHKFRDFGGGRNFFIDKTNRTGLKVSLRLSSWTHRDPVTIFKMSDAATQENTPIEEAVDYEHGEELLLGGAKKLSLVSSVPTSMRPSSSRRRHGRLSRTRNEKREGTKVLIRLFSFPEHLRMPHHFRSKRKTILWEMPFGIS